MKAGWLPRPVLFFHIPKTAGTSFKNALVQLLGDSQVLRDYGARSGQTSPTIRELVYKQRDLYKLGKEVKARGIDCLVGHFPLRKYIALFGAESVVTFCRNPREQVLSNYHHWVRKNHYTGSLSEFLRQKCSNGFQTTLFGDIPLDALGTVCLTERYQDSLRLVAAQHHMVVPQKTLNINPDRAATGSYSVPEDDEQAYAQAVDSDNDLYERAVGQFGRHLRSLDAGQRFVRGSIQHMDSAGIRGFAFVPWSDDAVQVRLDVNGKTVAELVASVDRPMLRGIVHTRNAFVGFGFNKAGMIRPGDKIDVLTVDGDQLIASSVLNDDVPQHH